MLTIKNLSKKMNQKRNHINIIETLQSSTSHSVSRITNAKYLSIKIVWIIASVLSISACCFIIVKTISEYLKFDVVTKVRVFNELEAEFPVISFCNKDPLVKKENRQIFLNMIEQQFNTTDYTDVDPDLMMLTYEKFMSFIFSNLTDQQKKEFGYSFEEMVLVCQFQYVNCRDFSEFVWFYHNEWGNCYRFNSGFNTTGQSIPLRTTNLFSRGSGLQLALFVGIEDDAESLNVYEYSKGLYLAIQNSTSLKNMYTSYGLASSSLNYIEMNKNFIQKIGRPYSDCEAHLNSSKSHLVKYFVDNHLKYEFKECTLLLIQENVIKNCKCATKLFRNIYNTRYCSTEQDFICISNGAFYSTLTTEEKSILCPRECDSVNFDLKFTFSPLSTRFIRELRKHPNVISKYQDISLVTDEQISNSVIMLDIYFESLTYTEIAEVPVFTIINLISNIGGTLGLFLGLSLLSFIEIVELFFNILMNEFNSKVNSIL
jgi:hypothetical protein